MSIKISLTQFLTFASKVSTSARINYVRASKEQEYSPAIDYWKLLRDAIKDVAAGIQKPEHILEVAESIPKEAKRKNYINDAKRFISFLTSHDVKFFTVGRASWTLDNLFAINASPEIGMEIDGEKYCVKLYYKVKDSGTKITKKNIKSTLALMQLADKDFATDDLKFAVLNLQNGKFLLSDSYPDDADTLELTIDAQNLKDIWTSV
ncbi:hypothetical protein ABTQ33_07680 [Paucilactobacillus suebicus]|uniref:Uncharacterized protein n=1 Tax=Paucilactobacillus suebicus DSM 5007 = KCTC 3549 TaxID=1423807 RepID=A0A0R1W233_9LACO|nr:hypothetical protein [Paucilactobacillus suebicus]KRM10187.1 hypothetical protein FD16_GL001457 [Paucilactobacillus suebicus DSM 5007 = KCTC 3549]